MALFKGPCTSSPGSGQVPRPEYRVVEEIREVEVPEIRKEIKSPPPRRERRQLRAGRWCVAWRGTERKALAALPFSQIT